jgi:hypothetical protein
MMTRRTPCPDRFSTGARCSPLAKWTLSNRSTVTVSPAQVAAGPPSSTTYIRLFADGRHIR